MRRESSWMKRLHPEGIPWPFCRLYNAISRSAAFQLQYERMARDIALFRTEGELLDVGTGPGWLLLKLQANCPDLRLVGADIAPGMVAQARKNATAAGRANRIEFVQGSADQLPFPGASFDLVVSSGSLHHWKAPVAGLDEIHRVLRPGGWALIYDLVKRMPREVRREAAREFGRLRLQLLWLHSFEEPFYEPEEMLSVARSSQFREGKTAFVGVACRLTMQKT